MCFRPTAANKKMKRCPSCQTLNPPVLKKCNKCGSDLPEEADVQTKGTTNQGTPAKGAAPGVPTKASDQDAEDKAT